MKICGLTLCEKRIILVQISMFLGTFSTKLMPNNQFVLPAKLSRTLTGNVLIIARGFDKCIYGFTVEEWQKIAEAELLKPLLSN